MVSLFLSFRTHLFIFLPVLRLISSFLRERLGCSVKYGVKVILRANQISLRLTFLFKKKTLFGLLLWGGLSCSWDFLWEFWKWFMYHLFLTAHFFFCNSSLYARHDDDMQSEFWNFRFDALQHTATRCNTHLFLTARFFCNSSLYAYHHA